MVYVFLYGEDKRDGTCDRHLADNYLVDAQLVSPSFTAPKYRLFSVNDQFPGLWPTDLGGCRIQGTLYDLPLDVLRERLLADKPAELELTTVELDDRNTALAMTLRRDDGNVDSLIDISEFECWRHYRARFRGLVRRPERPQLVC